MSYFDDTYFEDHLYLLELSTYLEPKSQYSLDYTFQSIDSELANYELWDTCNDGPIPTAYQEGDPSPGIGIRNTGSTAPTTTKAPSSQKMSSEISVIITSPTTKPSTPEIP